MVSDTGVVLPECAINTTKGTKVADIAWSSAQRFAIIAHETECSIAPEICIEVFSSSNTNIEMEEKKQLYLSAGAVEFWVCNEQGEVTFFNANGLLTTSNLVPTFPNKITLYERT